MEIQEILAAIGDLELTRRAQLRRIAELEERLVELEARDDAETHLPRDAD